jgi:hypothetical protein
MEFRRRQADYGSISVVTLNMGVAGIWVVDPLERPHVNYTQSTHPYIYLLFTFILYNPPYSLSPLSLTLTLSLSKQYYCMYHASFVASFYLSPKIYRALNCPGVQKEIPCLGDNCTYLKQNNCTYLKQNRKSIIFITL